MKRLFLFVFLALGIQQFASAQDTFKTTAGEIKFNASTPLEDINALNKVVNAILKSESGDFASVLLMKDFNFRKKLMQEHFNENYVESETYPKGYFTGKIENFSMDDLNATAKKYKVSGKLTIHGVTKNISPDVYLSKKGDGISLSSDFIVRPEDYEIEVPKLLWKKIAQEVEVSVNFKLAGQ